MRENRKIQIATAVLISLFIAACGKDTQTDKGNEINPEEGIENLTETEEESGEKGDEIEADITSGDEIEAELAVESGQEPERTLPDNVIEVYEIEEAEYVDEVMPAQYMDDLSLLSDMKYANNTYAYQDGKVYYRRYHEDSYE